MQRRNRSEPLGEYAQARRQVQAQQENDRADNYQLEQIPTQLFIFMLSFFRHCHLDFGLKFEIRNLESFSSHRTAPGSV
jgi:hypothetical protein